MSARRNHLALLPTYAGAAIGFAAFLWLGAVPGVLYGGYLGLAMAAGLFGHAAEPTLLMRLVTGGGMVLGLLASLFFFLVAGAFVGTLAALPFAPLLRKLAQEPARPATVEAMAPRH